MTGSNNNIYMPFKAVIEEAIDMGCNVKFFKVIPIPPHPPLSKGGRGGFIDYLPGQFFMVSQWGAGEAPISVTSTRGLQRHIEFAIKKVGTVTTVLHKLKKDDNIWLRGPYGNGFNAAAAKKEDVVFIAGGIGIIPLRSLINFIQMRKKQYGKIFLLYGAKNPSEILFKEDLKTWNKKGIEITLTVDVHPVRNTFSNGVKNKSWRGNTGLVTEHIDKIKTDFKNAYSYICGPDIMIEKTMKELTSRGMPDRQIITTLEARMKCGVGKCGQCYHGIEYICTNGPVYTYEEIKKRRVYGP